jgi:radical SAM superfamily enzyme YgiQ (UPF0313 family)
MIFIMSSHGKVILHCMPPAMPTMASPSFSILKGFLGHHGIRCEIMYWNISIFRLMLPYFQKLKSGQAGTKDAFYISPFLYDIAEYLEDSNAKRRICTFFHSLFPQDAVDRESEVAVKVLRNQIHELMDAGINKISEDGVLLFGFSSKLYQWIPGMVMAKELKKRFPDIEIAVGGFGGRRGAVEVLKVCPDFDFSVWGEGEYPLLRLCEALERDTFDPETVPRMIHRDGDSLLETRGSGELLALDSGISPDFSDFIETIGDKASAVQFPLESSRGCYWNKCKFCCFAAGARYRKKPLVNIIEEIEKLYFDQHIESFRFVDTNVVGQSIDKFEELLDAVIASAGKTGGEYKFYAEIMPVGFNARVVKKLAAAGFCEVQIGYEAITDDLLKKAGKKSDFSDLALFLKFALKYGISVLGANVIRGMVGETEKDVADSTRNLAYLRFFLRRRPGGFWHNLRELRLQGGTRFFDMVDIEDKKHWKNNSTAYLLPDAITGSDERFELFDFTRELENKTEWERFERINAFYESAEITYRVTQKDGVRSITEFLDKNPLKITALTPEAWDILEACNDEVLNLGDVFQSVRLKHQALTRNRCATIIADLDKSRLLYSNRDMTRIVSIIDTVLDTEPKLIHPSINQLSDR